MTAVIVEERPLVRTAAKSSHPVRLLQWYAVLLMVFPGDYVVKAIGGDGYPAALVSYLMFLVWGAAALLGHHNPFRYHYRVRIGLVWLWVASLASYVMMQRPFLSGFQTASADRWLEQLAGLSGIILVAAEGLHTLDDVRRVLRALIWGGAFCGIVAVLQFKARIDLTNYYLKIPGFSINAIAAVNADIISRNGQNRVPGTTTDPIELGVVAGMLLALAVYMMMHEVGQPAWKRVLPVICIALSAVASVSRSSVIAVAAAIGVLIVCLPPVRRLKALAAVPVALSIVFVAAHGLIGTLTSFFLAGNSDPSIAHRTNNYPYVEQLVREAPWFGTGPGTYMPASQVNILDNQYLTVSIELGLFGLLATLIYLAWPIVVALAARAHTANSELRDLCAALAGAELAALLCSATFDSFSFPTFLNLQALVVGLVGAAWRLIHEDQNSISMIQSGGI